jgi:histidinol-phosphate aminotransferase
MKLDAMENPYELPRELRKELGQRLADAVLNRYPVASYATLKEKVSARLGIPDGYEVMLGNGSDELIQIVDHHGRQPEAARHRAGADARLRHVRALGPVRGRRFRRRQAEQGLLARHGRHAGSDRPAPAGRRLPGLPEQPDRQPVRGEDIDAIIQARGRQGHRRDRRSLPAVRGTTLMGLLLEHENVVVMRTVSKLGLAGIRLGYMTAASATAGRVREGAPAV